MFKAEDDIDIYSRVDRYISELLAPQSQVLKQVSKSLEENNIPDASISASQGKLLQVLAAACNAKRILELGTLGAYSSIWLANALPEDGELITVEYDEHHAKLAQANIEMAGLSGKVSIRVGKALDILPKLYEEKQGPFDMVFIDADKPPYKEYFEWAIKLGRPGSIVVADNVVRGGEVLDSNSGDEKVQGVQRLNEFLSQCIEVTATIIQTVGVKAHDGMVIAVIK